MTTRTDVSRGHPAIKAILKEITPYWTTRKVTVVIADDDWSLEIKRNVPVATVVYGVSLGGDQVGRADYFDNDASVRGPARYTPRMIAGGVLVVGLVERGIEIVVSARGWSAGQWSEQTMSIKSCVMDEESIAVAVDTILQGGSRARIRRTVEATLVPCGAYAGLASAVAYGRAKLLTLRHEVARALAEATEIQQVDDAIATFARRAGRSEALALLQANDGVYELHKAAVARRLGKTPDELSQEVVWPGTEVFS